MQATNKFNPKPGDKIICNNGKEFICCEQEFLRNKGCLVSEYENTLFGFYDNPNNSLTGVSWASWSFEEESDTHPDWNIREVIPKQEEEIMPTEQESKYTVEEVLDAIESATPLAAPYSYIDEVKEYLSRKNDVQYQEYLRLKAIYE